MRFSRILFAVSIGVALAAACGGWSVSNSVGSDGRKLIDSGAGSSSTGSSSGTASGGGTGSGSGAGGSSGFIVTDSGAIAPTGVPCGNTANNLQIYCTGSQACCTTISPPEGPAEDPLSSIEPCGRPKHLSRGRIRDGLHGVD